MRISDWSSDVCSSDLWAYFIGLGHYSAALVRAGRVLAERRTALRDALNHYLHERVSIETAPGASAYWVSVPAGMDARADRSEEHTSELQSLMRISYAVFCLKKKNKIQ